MAQTSRVFVALKSCLRSRGLTYVDVAEHLGLSEATVKRAFATESLSVKRLDRICDLLNIEMTNLLEMVASEVELTDHLTPEQEQALVDDTTLLLVFYLLVNDWRFEDLESEYALTELQLIQLAAKLDRLGLIDLNPGNRVRLKVSRALQWRPNGAMRKFFDEKVLPEFLAGRFDGADELYQFIPALLSPEAVDRVRERLLALGQEVNELLKLDGVRAGKQRKGCSLMLAFRHWEFSEFGDLRGEP